MAETALIVEDNPDTNEIMAQQVQLRDYEPIQAFTGEDGLHKAERYRPDVMLLDLMLPELNGFEVCRRLRTHAETCMIPIVMVTALAEDENRVAGYRVGANCYVTKPYSVDALFRAMDRAVQWKRDLVSRRVEREITIDLSSDTKYLQDITTMLVSLLTQTSLGETEVGHIRQALLEMGQNAIEWGNRNNVDKLVKIWYHLYPDRVEFTIRDQGEGFDPSNLPHAARLEDPIAHMDIREALGLREGGFGILITSGFLDELRYNERGNEVTLVKRFKTVTSDE